MRNNLEEPWLRPFHEVVASLNINDDCIQQGMGHANRFECGFDLVGSQRFQFGDLRVELPDRTVVVEIESAGGLTNLVKYWPLAAKPGKPLLLLHVYAQGSENDYIAHVHLWRFVMERIQEDLDRQGRRRLFAAQSRFLKCDLATLNQALGVFRAAVSLPIEAATASFTQTRVLVPQSSDSHSTD